ncbi:hypothetical protein FA13DRAFT_986541 [Coprinellus micaceus]|uniref:Uncharacterized protein n=1 Tax=Coprinellus micaceus TaxID=71717 RepID=A0A4Y7SYL8_COPMI|nr:hypothetical protein FA13DRAFT_986541 [Coprinellus micaceus]
MATDISNIAQTAYDVYRTFDEVLMWWLNPSLVAPWVDLKFRYLDAVRNSIGLAETTVDVLQRFDEVYMAKVEAIQTEQDRLEAIELLETFHREHPPRHC